LIPTLRCDKLRKFSHAHFCCSRPEKMQMSRQYSKNAKRALALITLCGASLFATAAEDTGELWEVTMKMEMAGMPMAMPARTNKVCQAKDKPQEEQAMPADDKDCKMTDMKRSGNKSSFTVVCSGKNKFTGKGEFERSADRYSGKMHMTGTMDGESMDMTQTFSGRKVGTCTYKDPTAVGKEMLAKHEASMAEECRRHAERLEYQVFNGDLVPACKPYKKDFCNRVTRLSKDMDTASGFRTEADKGRDYQNIFATCGLDFAKTTESACLDGKNKKDWDFIGRHCPVEAKAIAQEQCAGRDYTAVMSGPYATICRQHAANQMRRDSREVQPADAVKEGVKSSLKKLLPF
jgi:hypothetical protein